MATRLLRGESNRGNSSLIRSVISCEGFSTVGFRFHDYMSWACELTWVDKQMGVQGVDDGRSKELSFLLHFAGFDTCDVRPRSGHASRGSLHLHVVLQQSVTVGC